MGYLKWQVGPNVFLEITVNSRTASITNVEVTGSGDCYETKSQYHLVEQSGFEHEQELYPAGGPFTSQITVDGDRGEQNFIFDELDTITVAEGVTSIGQQLFETTTYHGGTPDPEGHFHINILGKIHLISREAFTWSTYGNITFAQQSTITVCRAAFRAFCGATIDFNQSDIIINGSDQYAFADCGALRTLNIRNILSKIPAFTFSNCYRLTQFCNNNYIRIGIEDMPFELCQSLDSLSISSDATITRTYATEDAQSKTAFLIRTKEEIDQSGYVDVPYPSNFDATTGYQKTTLATNNSNFINLNWSANNRQITLVEPLPEEKDITQIILPDGTICNINNPGGDIPGYLEAQPFTDYATYNVNDYVIHDGLLYKCITAITVGDTWDNVVNNFENTVIFSELTNLANSGGGSDLPSYIDIPEFNSYYTYQVGDYCKYDNQMYICISEVDTPDTWDNVSSHFITTTVPHELNEASVAASDAKKDTDFIKDFIGLREFSESSTYGVGQFVIYDNSIYRCIKDHNGAWNYQDFVQYVLSPELQSFRVKTAGFGDSISQDFYNPNNTYSMGDYVFYNNDSVKGQYSLYKCTGNNVTGTWDSSKWTKVYILDELKKLNHGRTYIDIRSYLTVDTTNNKLTFEIPIYDIYDNFINLKYVDVYLYINKLEADYNYSFNIPFYVDGFTSSKGIPQQIGVYTVGSTKHPLYAVYNETVIATSNLDFDLKFYYLDGSNAMVDCSSDLLAAVSSAGLII